MLVIALCVFIFCGQLFGRSSQVAINRVPVSQDAMPLQRDWRECDLIFTQGVEMREDCVECRDPLFAETFRLAQQSLGGSRGFA